MNYILLVEIILKLLIKLTETPKLFFQTKSIKNLIIQAIRDGGSDSAISIHSAMAHAMCDTITDIKGPYQSQITQTFVESWSLATSHMEHKLTYFLRMLLLKNKKKGSQRDSELSEINLAAARLISQAARSESCFGGEPARSARLISRLPD